MKQETGSDSLLTLPSLETGRDGAGTSTCTPLHAINFTVSIEEASLPAAALSSLGLRRHEIIGYGTIVALGVGPALLLLAISPFASLPARDGDGPAPFAVFSLTILAILLALRPLQLVFSGHPEPLRQLRADIGRHWVWLIIVLMMVMVVPETLDVATRLKKIIPQIQPFYADRAIADAEHAILGQDAWRITHAVLGDAATRVIDLIYGLWHLVNISMLCWIVLTPNRRLQLQAALSYQLAWLLMGSLLAMALSSVGPCFYETFTGDSRFHPLMEQLRAVNGAKGLHSLIAMDYLLSTRGTNAFGGGISAMPSLHVGVAVYAVLMVHHVWPKNRTPLVLAMAYAAVIFTGSVHLGWHYALDGIVAGCGMWAIWKSVAWWLVWLERRYG